MVKSSFKIYVDGVKWSCLVKDFVANPKARTILNQIIFYPSKT